jgi:mRNA-degrading endonuclease RelE of RelBE toxin-antitoxin system
MMEKKLEEGKEKHWRIIPKIPFYKDMEKATKETRDRARVQLDRLEVSKSLSEMGNIRKLKNKKNTYRLKFGKFRIIFEKEGNILILTALLDRKEAYKKK